MEAEIIRVKYADSWIPESWVFDSGDKGKSVPIEFAVFLIKTGDKNILVDAGCETMPGFEMKNFDGTILALQNMGIQPEAITDVIITHAHHDHIECIKYFERASVYIQREEYLKGEHYIPRHFPVGLFDEECQVANNVRCIKIGGHTVGSSIVEVKNGDKTYVLCGDECYTYYNLTHGVATGNSFCREKSQQFISKYTGGEYVCLLCHDGAHDRLDGSLCAIDKSGESRA